MIKSTKRKNLKNLIFDNWHGQLHRINMTLIISFLIGVVGIVSVIIASRIFNVPPSWFTRDPNDITGEHAYIGFLSNLGIMGWIASAAICFLAASIMKMDKRFNKTTLFLFFSGLICLLLGFDDEFMLHDRVLPKYHIPEIVMYTGYFIIIAAYLTYFIRIILRTEYLILVLAIFFLGLSAVIDQIFPFSESEAFIEDCPKFIGIVLWLAYYSRTSFFSIKESKEKFLLRHRK